MCGCGGTTAIDYAEGRPLVEVYSVRFPDGEAPSTSGTVTVFDGRRGQIICKGGATTTGRPPSSHAQIGLPNHHPSQQNRLVLTGPYRAISADGCVAIVLDLHHHGSCQDHEEASRIYIDTYEPYTPYDEAITKEVETGYGGIARVTYALLSSAVEATVEVKLLAPRDGVDLARIFAKTIEDGVVVLFDGDKVCDDGSQEVIIPLARSVLAVPTNCPLTIVVGLIDYCGNPIMNETIEFSPQLDGERMKRLDGTDCAVEVKITWSDDD